MEKISIVIVSMNKLSNLDICLPSIERYTTVSHKIYVVAYLFSQENLNLLRDRYPYVEVIESNEIRGFSENNNLALRQVESEYTFVLNDDTEFKEPVLDKLLLSLERTPGATVMSPVLYRGDGSVQFWGRREYPFSWFLEGHLGIHYENKSVYTDQSGIFKTYNISGAAFLIKTEVFRQVGFFDESYFFCPEDVALSTLLNEKGYYCYVDADCSLTHYEGVSSKKSKLFYATTSAAYLGSSYFYGDNTLKRYVILLLWLSKFICFKLLNLVKPNDHRLDYEYIYKRVLSSYWHKITTKQLFVEEYNKVTNSQ